MNIKTLIDNIAKGDTQSLIALIDNLTNMGLTHQLNQILDYCRHAQTPPDKNGTIEIPGLANQLKRILFWHYRETDKIIITPNTIATKGPTSPFCSVCDGTGRSTAGLDNEIDPCKSCNGTGKPQSCQPCEGTGEITETDWPSGFMQTRKCQKCAGTGKPNNKI